MASSTRQRTGEFTISTRIAGGIILGLGCFAAVLTGGVIVGQTIGEALSTVQIMDPVEIDPQRWLDAVGGMFCREMDGDNRCFLLSFNSRT